MQQERGTWRAACLRSNGTIVIHALRGVDFGNIMSWSKLGFYTIVSLLSWVGFLFLARTRFVFIAFVASQDRITSTECQETWCPWSFVKRTDGNNNNNRAHSSHAHLTTQIEFYQLRHDLRRELHYGQILRQDSHSIDKTLEKSMVMTAGASVQLLIFCFQYFTIHDYVSKQKHILDFTITTSGRTSG